MPALHNLFYFLEYALIRLIGGLFNLFPFSFFLGLARPIGILLFRMRKRSRRIAFTNLRRVFGADKSESEIQTIARESFVHLAEFGVEWLRMKEIAKNPERYLAIRHVERVHEALKQKKGAILLVSHTGNWEIMALVAGHLIARPIGAALYALARPLKNPYLYRYILYLRGLTGLKSIHKIGGAQETLDRLRENGIVSLLIDQRVREGSVDTQFFGQEAMTTSLPALAAKRLGTPIFYVFLDRQPDLRFVMEVEGPAFIENTGDLRQDLQVNTQHFNDRIEAEIRKDPARWLWMHNRWRLAEEPKD